MFMSHTCRLTTGRPTQETVRGRAPRRWPRDTPPLAGLFWSWLSPSAGPRGAGARVGDQAVRLRPRRPSSPSARPGLSLLRPWRRHRREAKAVPAVCAARCPVWSSGPGLPQRRPLAAPPGGQQVSRGTERWLLSGPRAPPVPGAGLRRLPGRRLRGARSRHRLVSTRRRDTACLPGTVAGTGVLGCALLWWLWGTVAPGAWRGSREEVAHLRSLPLWGPAKGYVANGEGVRFAC